MCLGEDGISGFIAQSCSSTSRTIPKEQCGGQKGDEGHRRSCGSCRVQCQGIHSILECERNLK